MEPRLYGRSNRFGNGSGEFKLSFTNS